jgi:hypothetical protein
MRVCVMSVQCLRGCCATAELACLSALVEVNVAKVDAPSGSGVCACHTAAGEHIAAASTPATTIELMTLLLQLKHIMVRSQCIV